MTTTNDKKLAEIFSRWRSEDRSLGNARDLLMNWMREVEKLGIPHFGETADKLRPFRDLLTSHFKHEDEMLDELATHYDKASPEIAAIRRQTGRDHQHLLHDLDDFVERLNRLQPPFDSWQIAMREFDLFFSRLEQHEEQESESITTMIPGL
jgi:hypothetical protein